MHPFFIFALQVKNMFFKPLKKKLRSNFRIWCGKITYSAIRRINWLRFYKQLHIKINKGQLPHIIFQHQTPLIRNLKKVELWLQYNKVENLKIALKKINGISIPPGKTFSFWYLIGNPTKSKGYKKGFMLQNGKPVASFGGGLCQLSNMIYWMALHTDLSITERHRHSYDVFPDANRKLPFGSGATVSYNYIDLQITNYTPNTYQFTFTIDKENLYGEIRCSQVQQHIYQIIEKNHLIKKEFWGGYSRNNEIWRQKLLYNKLLSEELITTNHAMMMYEPLLKAKNS